MKYEETVILSSNEPLDYKKLAEIDRILRGKGITLSLIDIECRCLEKCQELLKQKGTTYILSLDIFQQEMLLPPVVLETGYAAPFLIQTLRDKLQSLSPRESLTIIDNDLFSPKLENSANHLRILAEILVGLVDTVKRITFITHPTYDSSLYDEVKQLLHYLNSELVVTLNTADNFYDRFWIVDEHQGLFVGASLNGVGQKYALVDNMHDEDTVKIVEQLRQRNLL